LGGTVKLDHIDLSATDRSGKQTPTPSNPSIDGPGSASATPSLRKKKVFLVRRKVNASDSGLAPSPPASDAPASGAPASPLRKVLVARRIKPGQTIQLDAATRVTLPERDASNSGAIRTEPEALARGQPWQGPLRSGPGGSGAVVPWEVLGGAAEFEATERLLATGSAALPEEPLVEMGAGEFKSRQARAKKIEDRMSRARLNELLFEDRLIATKDQRAMQSWRRTNKSWDSFERRIVRKLNKKRGVLAAKSDAWLQQKEDMELPNFWCMGCT